MSAIVRSIRLLSGSAALSVLAISAAGAQSCLGLAMPGRHYVGIESQRSFVSHARSTPVYGARYAHRWDAGDVGLTLGLAGSAGAMRSDSTAVNASVTLAASRRLSEVSDAMSVCAAFGAEGRGVDVSSDDRLTDADGDGYFSTPLTLGLGYDLHVGALTVTPFVAPSVARYWFESRAVENGARQRGWDAFVTTGASATLDRFTVSASYRRGDASLDGAGRFAFSTGVAF